MLINVLCVIHTPITMTNSQIKSKFMPSFHVSPVAGAPTLTPLDQISPTAVRVTWSPPSGGATVTGYVVHYIGGNKMRTEPSSSTSTDITGLTNGYTYAISVEATSQHLSGESERMTITLSELTYSCVE